MPVDWQLSPDDLTMPSPAGYLSVMAIDGEDMRYPSSIATAASPICAQRNPTLCATTRRVIALL